MNKFNVGEYVEKGGRVRQVISVIKTELGYVYDVYDPDSKEIEVWFEDTLNASNKIVF